MGALMFAGSRRVPPRKGTPGGYEKHAEARYPEHASACFR